MGSKQYGVDHLNMEINKFTVERKVYRRLNQSQFRISILVFFSVNFTGYQPITDRFRVNLLLMRNTWPGKGKLYRWLTNQRQVESKFTIREKHMFTKARLFPFARGLWMSIPFRISLFKRNFTLSKKKKPKMSKQQKCDRALSQEILGPV